MRRWLPHLATSLFLVGVLSPLFGPADRQSVPISHYPMYADDEGAVVSFPTLFDVEQGEAVPMRLLATDDPLVAVTTLRRTINRGPKAALDLCQEMADQLGGATIELATERHDAVAWLDARPSLVDRQVHARCGGGS